MLEPNQTSTILFSSVPFSSKATSSKKPPLTTQSREAVLPPRSSLAHVCAAFSVWHHPELDYLSVDFCLIHPNVSPMRPKILTVLFSAISSPSRSRRSISI